MRTGIASQKITYGFEMQGKDSLGYLALQSLLPRPSVAFFIISLHSIL